MPCFYFKTARGEKPAASSANVTFGALYASLVIVAQLCATLLSLSYHSYEVT